MPASVYILYSAKLDKYYTGSTSITFAGRLRRHLSSHKGFTGKASDWKVVFSEIYEDKLSALKREKEIKSWKSRKKIEQLLVKDIEHPAFSGKAIPICIGIRITIGSGELFSAFL